MERGYILTFLSILSLNFVSALGGYSSFGFSGLFSEFNIAMYLNALLFITLFAVIFFILKKSPFRENAAVCWIISLCVSAFGMYGILSTGFSFQSLVHTLGISSDLLTTILWMIGLVILIFLFLKFKFRGTFAILFALTGILLILLSLFNVLYEKSAGIAIGIGFLLIALILKKKDSGSSRVSDALSGIKDKGGKLVKGSLDMTRLVVDIDGRKYNAGFGSRVITSISPSSAKEIYVVNSGRNILVWKAKKVRGVTIDNHGGEISQRGYSKIKIRNNLGKSNKKIIIIGRGKDQFKWQKIKIIINDGKSSPPTSPGSASPRLDILKNLAIQYRKWADTQKKADGSLDKRYRSWAYFLNWLKKEGYSSEKELMTKLGVTHGDIVWVVKKYVL